MSRRGLQRGLGLVAELGADRGADWGGVLDQRARPGRPPGEVEPRPTTQMYIEYGAKWVSDTIHQKVLQTNANNTVIMSGRK